MHPGTAGNVVAVVAALLLAAARADVIVDMTEGPLQETSGPTDSEEEQAGSVINTTFVNETTAGFTPTFQVAPILPETNDSQRQVTKSPVSERPNTIFNNPRPIRFDNGQASVDNELRKPLFRPSEADPNFVKFEDNRSSSDHRYDNQQSPKVQNQRFEQVVPSSAYPEQQPIAFIVENYENQQPQYGTYESKPTYQQQVVQNENPYHHYQPEQLELYHPDGKLMKPETVINVRPVSFQTMTHHEAHSKPKTVVYMTSHEVTRMRKFPYHYYNQPQLYEGTDTPIAIPEHGDDYQYPIFYEQPQKSISPWKKILHIIGAFLPLGLLFALLTPKVINTGQTTEPSVILSKLRVNDLEAEHKNTRPAPAESQPEPLHCEEITVCRLLAAADSTKARFLRRLLRQFTDRTADAAVRKKELDRIFEAAKLENCDILTCDFYDGT